MSGRARDAEVPGPGLVELIDRGGVESVVVAVVDVQGRMKGKALDAGVLRSRLARGPVSGEMCGYLLGTDLGMTPARSGVWSWESGFGDVGLALELERARLLPGAAGTAGTALVWARPVQADGRPHPLSPVTILDRQLAALAGAGLVPMVGLETEFVLVEGAERDAERDGWRLRPATIGNLDYALDVPAPVAAFLRELRQVLAGAGIPVESLKLEGAPGQVEVAFPYGPVETACEQHLLFKHAARAVAWRHGMSALFMASPVTGTGSGLHLHLSLHQVHGDGAVFAPDGEDALLSETGLRAVAGLLDVLPVTGPMWAPTVNSYRRFAVEHSFAPTRATWGKDNRSCAVRVVGHGAGRHVEVRVPGADANPYLAVAAALGGIRHGIDNGLTPPRPASGDSYLDMKAWPLPRDLAQAVREFESDRLPPKLFGSAEVAHLAAVARLELAHHAPRVSAGEVARGFSQS
ncbi:glutamine synthetase family protein [Kitasatospora griseola]|uniref:glutamine synthetase family protein n=1 Tax=Kitasatospora griseola TaxID=2064 RepID=UPI00342D1C62